MLWFAVNRGDSAMTVAGTACRMLVLTLSFIGALTLSCRDVLAAETLRVGKSTLTSFSYTLLEVGMQAGIFAKHGLTIESSAFGGGPRLIQAMTAGAIDIGLDGGTDMALIVKGAPMKAVAPLSGAPTEMAITVKAAGPVKSVADLKGRKIAITGAGTLTKSGTTTAIIATNNTYSGGTTISGGVLQVGNGGTVGSLGSGLITDNATLAFNRSDSFSFANAITGTGGVTQQGTGTVNLTGINNYSGTTTISSGTLIIGLAGALPNGGAVSNNNTFIVNANSTAGAVSGSGATTVNPGVTFTAGNFSQAGGMINNGTTQINGNGTVGPIAGTGSLTIGNGATTNTLALAHNSGGSTQSNITINTGAKLDINNNHMFFTTTPLATIRGYVISGTIFSALSDTTHAVGYATVAGPQVEVKWTLKGDADLSGTVDVGDLGKLATNYGTVTTGATWAQGDFTYDGSVDVGDLGALATNYGLTLAGGAGDAMGNVSFPGSSSAPLDVVDGSLGLPSTGSVGAGTIAYSPSTFVLGDGTVASATAAAAVPEPGTLSLLALAGLACLSRRGRKST
jgi:autotransporter-associated beta strand protein